jgi:long-chain acyl-CoA synthetase
VEWAYKQGITEKDPEKLIRLEPVKELYRELVESFNKFFNHVEQVKRFELLSREWSVDSGEMTPKLSVKRKVILEKYRDAIERIYL